MTTKKVTVTFGIELNMENILNDSPDLTQQDLTDAIKETTQEFIEKEMRQDEYFKMKDLEVVVK